MDDGYQDYLNREMQRNESWMGVEMSERMFDQCQEKMKIMKCMVHKRRAYADWEYGEDYSTLVTIRRACCLTFAKDVQQIFVDADSFTKVQVNLAELKFK